MIFEYSHQMGYPPPLFSTTACFVITPLSNLHILTLSADYPNIYIDIAEIFKPHAVLHHSKDDLLVTSYGF